jgi:hypothetical protein
MKNAFEASGSSPQRNSQLKSPSTPRIISFRRAKCPRHGVTVYAYVQSKSRPSVNHVVTGIKSGKALRWSCSCEIRSFNPRRPCAHIVTVRRRAVKR